MIQIKNEERKKKKEKQKKVKIEKKEKMTGNDRVDIVGGNDDDDG